MFTTKDYFSQKDPIAELAEKIGVKPNTPEMFTLQDYYKQNPQKDILEFILNLEKLQ